MWNALFYAVNHEALVEDDESKNTGPDYETLTNNSSLSSFHHHNNTVSNDRHAHRGHRVSNGVSMTTGLNSNYHELEERDRSSLVYHEVGPTLTEALREPQDYAMPVVSTSGVSTLESQPYEVPQKSLHKHHLDTKVSLSV